jgi:two-component system, chemotaxis family, protein-glutamate methylesterase/glutaminase
VASDRRIHTFVIGASAGGVEALRDLVAALPDGFPGVLLVVLHLAPTATSVLPQILSRAGSLESHAAVDGGSLEGGCIYVAPPDYHLLVEDGCSRLDHGPRVNGHRPAVDNLFQSAAAAYGAGVCGIVLSGVLDDGAEGLMAIKRAGGLTLVQDPKEALYPAMPSNAIEYMRPDAVGPVAELADEMARVAGPPPEDPPAAAGDPREAAVIAVDRGSSDNPQPGEPTGLTCPECNGAIWEETKDGLTRMRCRTGHEYAPETFTAAQGERVEAALWTALRTLEEQAALHRRIATRYRNRGSARLAGRFAARADASLEHAIVLRQILNELDVAEDEGVA